MSLGKLWWPWNLIPVTVWFGNVWLFYCTFAGTILSFLKYEKRHLLVRAWSISVLEIPMRGLRARCLLGLYWYALHNDAVTMKLLCCAVRAEAASTGCCGLLSGCD